MNPFALVLFGLGLILIVIGFKGSQHHVMDTFRGVKTTSTSNPSQVTAL
jgi:hypothetical protein